MNVKETLLNIRKSIKRKDIEKTRKISHIMLSDIKTLSQIKIAEKS